MQRVYTVNNEEDTFVIKLKNQLKEADNGNNSDLHITFKGYLHNRTGFKLRIENIEAFTDQLIEEWKQIINQNGLMCDFTADLSNAWVNITCKRILRQRTSIRERFTLPSFPFTISRIPLVIIAYLTVIMFSIYILWNRNKDAFLK
jgi:hypothetical protein